MKKILFMALTAAVALVGCKTEEHKVVNKPAVRTYAPQTNESGTQRAYEGDAVTLTGINLENITGVQFEYSANTVEQELLYADATIVTKEIKTLVFAIPSMPELAQNDAPHNTTFRVMMGDEVIYTMQYYVTVPVTDAIVSAITTTGVTIGSEITVTGRNLDKVTSIQILAVNIPAADFTLATATQIKFALPVAAYERGTSEVSITVNWDRNGTSEQIIPLTPLSVRIPLGNITAPPTAAALGDEIEITGENLDLLDSVYIGTYKMVITDRASDGTSLTVRIPASIPKQTPAVVSWAVVGYFGIPTQSYTMHTAYPLDTTPLVIPVTPPAASGMTVEDGTTAKAYLKKVVTVTGTNLLNATAITVGGIAATIKEGATNTSLQFTIPETFAFVKATDCTVVATYQDGTVNFGTLTVFPFYYYKNLTMGCQDAANQNIAFLLPDEGRVASTENYNLLDPVGYAINATSVVTASAMATVFPTKEAYYAIQTYFFLTNQSTGKVQFNSPVNSASQLKNLKWNGISIIPGAANTYGSPVVMFRTISFSGCNASEHSYADSVKNGTLRGIYAGNLPQQRASSGAPSWDGTESANNTIKVGSVLWFVRPNWASATTILTTGAGTDIYKSGYMVITGVSGVSSATDGTNAATITFDLYWSRVITE